MGKRKIVELGKLIDNPFKKEIAGGAIDAHVVEQIMESASKTSFWDQWVAREAVDGYEIAFGHHRLAAAIKLFGKKHEVSIQLENYSDEQMLIALADENAGAEASLREQIDTVTTARKFLLKHNEACKVDVSSHGGTKRDSLGRVNEGKPHEHGSLNCVVAFLGDANWSRSKVGRILEASNTLDPFVVSKVAPVGTTHPGRQQALSTKAALAIGEIPDKKIQREVTKEILSDKNELGYQDIRGIVEEAKENIPAAKPQSLKGKSVTAPAPKEPTERDLKILRDAVNKVKEARARQEAAQETNAASKGKILQFARDIIKEGRRALAAKYHPDKGGKTEDMAAVNQAEQLLSSLLRKEN